MLPAVLACVLGGANPPPLLILHGPGDPLSVKKYAMNPGFIFA